MIKMRKRFIVLFAVVLILVCSPSAAMLAEGAAYTYTVRFYAGQQGTFADGRDVITFSGLSYGSVVSFNQGGVVLKDDSKYYVKGIRESGRDNNTVSASAFTVTSDRDYVVAYGLRGDMVAYTLYYVDESGAELAPSDTYYGNVGDKPVVSFLYIDGYQPQAYNLTRTLVADESQNVFTFVYTPIGGNVGDGTVTRTVLPGTDRSVVQVIPGNTSSVRNHGENMESLSYRESSSMNDLDANQNRALSDDVGSPVLADPLAGIDLDDGIDLADQAVPLADMMIKLGPVEMGAKMMLVMVILLMAIAVMAVASWWYWKPYWKRKKEDEEKNAAQPV